MQGAIAHTAETTFQTLTESQQAIAKRVFLRLTELGEGVQDTRRRVALRELGEGVAVETVIKRLADARLVTTGQDEVEVAHEALIREWPTLQEWLAEDREGLRLHRHLTEAAQIWLDLDRDPGALYRGLRLDQVMAWVEDHADLLNEQEQAFLDASLAERRRAIEERERIAREREEARQRELENQRKLAEQEAEAAGRLRRRALYLGVALVIAVLAVIVAGVLFGLANERLTQLKGLDLLQQAYDLKDAGDAEGAVEKLKEAVAADPNLDIDLDTEIEDVYRSVATKWVQEGEALAREGNYAARDEKFKAALALNPPLDTPVYVWVEGGPFTMGSDPNVDDLADSDEFDQREVDVPGFWIMRTEVTNGQYQRCMQAEADPCDPPDNNYYDNPQLARWPVTDVSWSDANDYARWVGGKLPTEAEWEKACRGGADIPVDSLEGWGALQENPLPGRIYPWGNESPTEELVNFNSNVGTVTDVGSYPDGVSPYGVLDMAGNVWEWTSSLYQDYPYQADDGREDPEAEGDRVVRGGSWFDRRQPRALRRPELGHRRCGQQCGVPGSVSRLLIL